MQIIYFDAIINIHKPHNETNFYKHAIEICGRNLFVTIANIFYANITNQK